MGKDGRIVLRTYAKVNLCLDVLHKRSDGFHEIDSLFQNISLYDKMEVHLFEGNGTLSVECNVEIENNILEKVWEYVRDRFVDENTDVEVKIDKRIPMGAGLGGGSSNAAGFICFLKYFGFVDEDEALQIAKAVGSDVPFFLYGGTAIVGGRGDKVTCVEPLKGYSLDIYYPNFSISTKEAYSKLKPEDFGKAPLKAEELYQAYVKRDYDLIQKGTYNIFEYVMPNALKEEIERLRTSSSAALTGSGSAYFQIRDGGKYRFVEKGVDVCGTEGN